MSGNVGEVEIIGGIGEGDCALGAGFECEGYERE